MTDDGTESDEERPWFRYSATLRIFGRIADLDEITATLGLSPTHTHRRGDRRGPQSPVLFEHDMWSYTSPVPADRPLDVHIQTLWSHIQTHKDFLIGLKERLTLDVFCGYHTNGSAGFEVSHRSLTMFIELEIPFGVSIL